MFKSLLRYKVQFVNFLKRERATQQVFLPLETPPKIIYRLFSIKLSYSLPFNTSSTLTITFSTLNPYSFNTTFPGAEAPKVWIPITFPLSPT